MTFGQHLIASCLNDACRHQALIDVSSYPADTEVPCRVKCGKCGGHGNKIDVRREPICAAPWDTRRATLASLLRKANMASASRRPVIRAGSAK